MSPAGGAGLFSFVQIEAPWPLGPPDGRYVLRGVGGDDVSTVSHVAVFATLGAPERRWRDRRPGARTRSREIAPEPAPSPVATGRATVIDVRDTLADEPAARAWLAQAGESELRTGLQVVNRALHAFRLVTADPYAGPVTRERLIAARLGYGAGDQVADGHWTRARELEEPAVRRRRREALAPQQRLATVLGARRATLACEELVLRARADLDAGRPREAALQVLVALDAALAELAADPTSGRLTARLDELRGQRGAIAAAAQSALAGTPSVDQQEAVAFTVTRIEAALRARAAAGS